MTNDEYWGVRFSVADVLGSAFSQLSDKQQGMLIPYWTGILKKQIFSEKEGSMAVLSSTN